MTIYLDASVLVSLLVDDANTDAARHLNRSMPLVAVSQWTLVECSSAFAKLSRMGRLTSQEQAELDEALDRWASRGPRVVPVSPDDFEASRRFVRNSRSGLRASDALHLAVSAREALAIATFDFVLTRAAEEFGVEIAEIPSH